MGLADGELHVLVIDLGHGVTGEAQIHGAVGLGGLADQLAGGVIVRRHDHGHVGDGAQHTHVLDGLVGGAVVGGGHAAVGAGDLYVQVGVADLLANHFAHTEGTEHGIGDDKGDLAAGGKTRSQACAVLLGDAHVQILLGQLLAEVAGLAALADINIHHQNVRVFLAQGHDLLAEAFAGSDLFLFAHCSFLLA